MISRRNKRKLKKRDVIKKVDIDALDYSLSIKQQINLCRALNNSDYFPGNEIQIFTNGKDKFDALIEDLNNAQSYINLQYYIFENDEIGNIIKNILIEKAKAGLNVRVIYDHV